MRREYKCTGHECKGCGATCTVEPSDTPGKATVFHPEPLCEYVLALLAAGIATGPIVPATLDRDTGEVVEVPHARNN